MTKEEILAMEAGNELNVLVATKIFNRNLPTLEQMKEIAEEQWKVQPDCIHFFRGFDAWMENGVFKWKYNEKDYSNDISAAWEIYKLMRNNQAFEEWLNYVCRKITGITALNICKAALLALIDS